MVTYTHTLTNLGNISDTIMLSVGSAPGSPTWTVGVTPTVVTLDPLISATISVSVEVPAGVAIGVQHVAMVTATSSSITPVLATAVNTTTAGIAAGVVIVPDANFTITDSGTQVEYVHTITNTGNVSDTFILTAVSNQGWLINFTDGPLPLLQPGESVTVTLTISVPVDAVAGQQDVTTLTATSSQDSGVSASAMDTTRVAQLYDLFLEPDNIQVTSSPAQVVYTHTLTNSGEGPDTYSFMAVSSQGWVVQWPSPVSLDAGTSTQIMVTLTVPISSEGLVDVMEVTAISLGNPSVVATATNTTVILGADGEAGVIIEPDQMGTAVPNQQLLYTHTVTNTGTYTDSYELTVVSSLGWPVSVLPNNLFALPPATTSTVTVVVDVPMGAPAGATDMTTVTVASLTAVTPTLDTAVDTTEVLQDFGLLLEPDRTMTVTAGTLVTYTHFLTNTGNVNDSYRITADSSQGWTTQVISEIVGLNAGEGTIIMVTLTVPAAGAGLTDTMIVRAQSVFNFSVQGVVTDTTIVTGTVPVSVLIEPDNIDTGLAGEALVYQHTVTNTGAVTDTFLIDATSSQGWLVTLAPPSIELGPGQAASVVVTVTIPGTAVPGTLDATTVTATSDSNSAVFDQAIDRTTVATPPNPTIYLPFITRAEDSTTPPPTPTPIGPTPTPTSCTATGVDLIVTGIQIVPQTHQRQVNRRQLWLRFGTRARKMWPLAITSMLISMWIESRLLSPLGTDMRVYKVQI